MTPIVWAAATATGVMLGLWAVQLRTKNATSVDVAWSWLIGALAILYALTAGGDPWRRGLVGALGAIWAFRLGAHLYRDRVRGRTEEDGRYAAMRAHYGTRAPRAFFFVYLAQAAAAVLFSLPFLGAMQGGPPGPWAIAGATVWLIAVVGEAVADRQLAAFRADPANRGEVCRAGLWRYSRHPNYFFEWLHWWTYVLIGHGAWLTWIGPVVMLVFLFRVSGIPHTEQQALRSRGDKYREYQRSTSPFVPWPPRS